MQDNYTNVLKSRVIEINVPAKFFQLMTQLRLGEWIFRGQNDCLWPLKTSLERSPVGQWVKSSRANILLPPRVRITYSAEYNAIEKFRQLAGISRDVTPVEILATMQHYGTPTRLLDFTKSLGVALFFSFFGRKPEQNPCIWAINFRALLFRNSILNETFKEEAAKVNIDINDYPEEADFMVESLTSDVFLNWGKRNTILLEKITKKYINISEEDIQDPLELSPVELIGNNPRIAAQEGLFLIPSSFYPFMDHLGEVFGLSGPEKDKLVTADSGDAVDSCLNDLLAENQILIVKIIFKSDCSWVNAALKNMNITARHLFPDLQGVAQSISYEDFC